MERRAKSLREDSYAAPEESIVDDVPSMPTPEAPARRKPTGPKPGKETPGGWRR